jgi:hypothetical protein
MRSRSSPSASRRRCSVLIVASMPCRYPGSGAPTGSLRRVSPLARVPLGRVRARWSPWPPAPPPSCPRPCALLGRRARGASAGCSPASARDQSRWRAPRPPGPDPVRGSPRRGRRTCRVGLARRVVRPAAPVARLDADAGQLVGQAALRVGNVVGRHRARAQGPPLLCAKHGRSATVNTHSPRTREGLAEQDASREYACRAWVSGARGTEKHKHPGRRPGASAAKRSTSPTRGR